MDASVPQNDGYRFVYLLPFASDRVFIEDTYYSDTPHLNQQVLRARIAEYVGKQGWRIANILREETVDLHHAMGGGFAPYEVAGGEGTPKARRSHGMFHTTTCRS